MGSVTLDLDGDLRRVQVQFAVSDYWSALALYAEVAADLSCGLPEPVRARLASKLPEQARWAMTPVAHPEEGLFPDCLLPDPTQRLTFTEQLELIESYRPDDIIGSIRREHPHPEHSPVWRTILPRSHQWVRSYAAGAQSVKAAFVDRWAPLHNRAARECERIGAAVVGGGLDGLFSSLSPRLRLSGTTLQFAHAVPGRYALNGRPIVLSPVVAGPRMLMSILDHPDYVWIAYPIQLPPRPFPGRTRDGLSLVLGDVRARILRSLDAPRTMTELAHTVHVAPNTLTFHCQRLEEADLLARRRAGKAVLVTRTERGSDLVDLLS